MWRLRRMSTYIAPPQTANMTSRKKVTIQSIKNLYRKQIPISMMTAHDYASGFFVDQAGIDMCLIGDSLAMVALGYESTNHITLDVIQINPGNDSPFTSSR